MKPLALVLSLVVATPAAPSFAACKGAQVHGSAEVPVEISARQMKSTSTARSVLDYDLSIGPENSMEVLCLHGTGSVVFTLPDSGRHEFREIRFEYPYGFEPTASPFKLVVVQPDSLVMHMISSPVSDGLWFKYTLAVEDTHNEALILIDPMIINEPRGVP